MLIQDFVEVEGAKLYYEMDGEGFPVVLIHGLALDCRMWDAQFADFADDFKAIRYDVRGFGKSSFAGEPKPHIAAADLKALLDHLEIEKAHLVGLSMGGNIALSFAQTYPERVAKLVSVDADVHGFDNYTEALKELFGEVYQIGASKGALKAKLTWARSSLLQPAHENPYTKALETMIKDYSGLHFTNPKLLPGSKPPTVEGLHQIQAETMIIVGERDTEDFHRIADLLVEKIPNVKEKIVIMNAGHMPNLEHPEGFNRTVKDFLLD